jgi:hypothetical protein
VKEAQEPENIHPREVGLSPAQYYIFKGLSGEVYFVVYQGQY